MGSPPFAQKHVLVAANINTLPVEVSGTNITVFVPLYTDDVLYGPPHLGNPYINPAFGREAVYDVSDGVSTATVRQSKNSITTNRSKNSVSVRDTTNSVEVRSGGKNYAIVWETENLVEVVKSENAA